MVVFCILLFGVQPPPGRLQAGCGGDSEAWFSKVRACFLKIARTLFEKGVPEVCPQLAEVRTVVYLCTTDIALDDMKTVLDLHTHTLVSGHAFSTIQEMVVQASSIGLPYLGITEHGPAIPGAPQPIYFRNLYCVPRSLNGVRLLMGAELNILDYNGSLDLDDDCCERLDHVIAGIHRQVFQPGTVVQNTDAVLAAMSNKRVNIISHPADGAARVDLEALVRASRDTQTLLEVNNSSVNPVRHKVGAVSNNIELLRLCRRYGVPVILGSDAHIAYSIADYSFLWPLIAETDFPEELIVNGDVRRFESFTGLHTCV